MTNDETTLGILSQTNFRRFWTSQTITAVGDQLTFVALPLAAVLLLGAGPLEMGVLAAANRVPLLLFGLLAGVWVDSVRRRPLMIAADLVRAALLAGAGLGLLLGVVGVVHLVAVAFAVGTTTVVANTANQALLPAIVSRDDLVLANTRVTQSRSMAQVVGPSAGGLFVQLLGPALVICGHVGFLLVSALFLRGVSVVETPESPDPGKRGIVRRIHAGLGVVWRNALLWGSAGCAATYTFFNAAIASLYILYLVRDLDVPTAAVGVIVASVGPGALVGSLAVVRLTEKFGAGRVMVAGVVGAGGAYGALPLMQGSIWIIVSLLCACFFLAGFAQPLYNINQSSIRQRIVPLSMMGRVGATMQFLAGSSAPLGAVVGGVLAQAIGVNLVLAAGAGGMILSAVWLWRGGVAKVTAVGRLAVISDGSGA